MPYSDPDAKRANARRYREENRDRLAAYKRRWHRERYASDPAYRDKVRADARRSRPKEVARAQQAVWRAVRAGSLVKPDTCEECGAQKAIEAAHRDYSRPLDVRWLCRSCHRIWDRAEPKSVSVGSASSRG